MQLDVNHQQITVDVLLRGADHKSCMIPYWMNPNVTSLAAQMLSEKKHVTVCEICTQTHLFTCLHDQENRVWSFLEEKKVTGSVTEDFCPAAAG